MKLTTVSDEVIKILDDLAKRFGIAIDWTSKNVLPYLQDICDRYINYEISMSIFYGVVGLAILIGAILFHKAIYKHKDWGVVKGTYIYDDFGRCLIYVGVGLMYVVSFLIIGFQTEHILHCIFLPELEIYEYVQNLIK